MKDLTPIELKLDLSYSLTPLERDLYQRTGMTLPLSLRRLLPQNRSKELVMAAALRYQAGDFKGAFLCVNEALQLWAENKEAWALGIASLAAANERERHALFLLPGNVFLRGQNKFWAGWIKLRNGEYTPETWDGWEERFSLWGMRHVVDRAEYWNGKSSLTGKTFFLDFEGGLGDIVQFGRCAPIIKAAGARIVVMLDKYFQRMAPLLWLCPAIDEIFPVDTYCPENVPPHDVGLTASSFPLVLGTTTENIPDAHWLPDPPQEKRECARAKIGSGPGLKIGLSWASSAASRNLPLRSFAELATIPGVNLFGLQRGKEAKELEGIDWVTNLEDADGDIVDTAAAMYELDLVITADTMTCHLAGALGRPVWTLLPTPCDWRWTNTDSTTTPWYPTMRLFRQTVEGDWSGPVAEVVAAVRAMIGAPTAPTLIADTRN